MFEQIIGQRSLIKFITREIERNELSSSYILLAPKNYGKKFIAYNIASTIAPVQNIVTVLPTEDRKNIAVDDIRELKKGAYVTTFSGKKVYVIPNADRMNTSCQNALLKLLEEPPQETVFLLLAEDGNKLLTTVRSRSTLLTLSPYSSEEVMLLAQVLYPDDAVNFELIPYCNGCISRYAYVKSPEFGKVKDLAIKIVSSINTMHPARVFAIFKKVKDMKDSLTELIAVMYNWYYTMYLYKIDNETSLQSIGSSETLFIQESLNYTESQLLEILDYFNKFDKILSYNCNLEMQFNKLLFIMKVR